MLLFAFPVSRTFVINQFCSLPDKAHFILAVVFNPATITKNISSKYSSTWKWWHTHTSCDTVGCSRRPATYVGCSRRPATYVGCSRRPATYVGCSRRPATYVGCSRRPATYVGCSRRPATYVGCSRRPATYVGCSRRPATYVGCSRRPATYVGCSRRPATYVGCSRRPATYVGCSRRPATYVGCSRRPATYVGCSRRPATYVGCSRRPATYVGCSRRPATYVGCSRRPATYVGCSPQTAGSSCTSAPVWSCRPSRSCSGPAPPPPPYRRTAGRRRRGRPERGTRACGSRRPPAPPRPPRGRTPGSYGAGSAPACRPPGSPGPGRWSGRAPTRSAQTPGDQHGSPLRSTGVPTDCEHCASCHASGHITAVCDRLRVYFNAAPLLHVVHCSLHNGGLNKDVVLWYQIVAQITGIVRWQSVWVTKLVILLRLFTCKKLKPFTICRILKSQEQYYLVDGRPFRLPLRGLARPRAWFSLLILLLLFVLQRPSSPLGM